MIMLHKLFTVEHEIVIHLDHAESSEGGKLLLLNGMNGAAPQPSTA